MVYVKHYKNIKKINMKKNELLSQDQLHSGKKDIILNNELLNQLSKKDISLSDDQVSKLLSLSPTAR